MRHKPGLANLDTIRRQETRYTGRLEARQILWAERKRRVCECPYLTIQIYILSFFRISRAIQMKSDLRSSQHRGYGGFTPSAPRLLTPS